MHVEELKNRGNEHNVQQHFKPNKTTFYIKTAATENTLTNHILSIAGTLFSLQLLM